MPAKRVAGLGLALIAPLAVAVASLAAQCGGLPGGLDATARAAGQGAGTAVAGAAGTGSALQATLAAKATLAAPTLQAAGTKVSSSAGTAIAEFTPPQTVDQDEAEAAVVEYAQDILGRDVTVVRAGGLTTEIEKLLNLPDEGDSARQSVADIAARSYAALLDGGAASVSYGTGALSGDLSVDINSSSLGAFVFSGGALPTNGDEQLALALAAFPGLADRTYTPKLVVNGLAWTSQGLVPGFDSKTFAASLVAEKILLAIVPAGLNRTAISVVVGKGDFAAQVAP